VNDMAPKSWKAKALSLQKALAANAKPKAMPKPKVKAAVAGAKNAAAAKAAAVAAKAAAKAAGLGIVAPGGMGGGAVGARPWGFGFGAPPPPAAGFVFPPPPVGRAGKAKAATRGSWDAAAHAARAAFPAAPWALGAGGGVGGALAGAFQQAMAPGPGAHAGVPMPPPPPGAVPSALVPWATMPNMGFMPAIPGGAGPVHRDGGFDPVKGLKGGGSGDGPWIISPNVPGGLDLLGLSTGHVLEAGVDEGAGHLLGTVLFRLVSVYPADHLGMLMEVEFGGASSVQLGIQLEQLFPGPMTGRPHSLLHLCRSERTSCTAPPPFGRQCFHTHLFRLRDPVNIQEVWAKACVKLVVVLSW